MPTKKPSAQKVSQQLREQREKPSPPVAIMVILPFKLVQVVALTTVVLTTIAEFLVTIAFEEMLVQPFASLTFIV